jgi:hypothetical protein
MVPIAPLLLLSLSAHAQDCAVSSTSAELVETLQSAEAAWQSADEKGFLSKMEEAVIQLPCVNDPLEPALAARYHRDLGLWLWVSKQPERAQEAFGAAKRVDPGAGLPKELAPKGHPVRKMFDASEPADAAAAVPPPVEGKVLFDGSEGERPTQVNTVFQLEAEGLATLTSYLRPGTALPEYEVYVAPPETGPKGWHFAVGAGALAAASGGLLLGARSTHIEFTEQSPDNGTDLDSLYAKNRALSTSSAILAGTAGALGVVAVFTW